MSITAATMTNPVTLKIINGLMSTAESPNPYVNHVVVSHDHRSVIPSVMALNRFKRERKTCSMSASFLYDPDDGEHQGHDQWYANEQTDTDSWEDHEGENRRYGGESPIRESESRE